MDCCPDPNSILHPCVLQDGRCAPKIHQVSADGRMLLVIFPFSYFIMNMAVITQWVKKTGTNI